jgi:hypothetical protein
MKRDWFVWGQMGQYVLKACGRIVQKMGTLLPTGQTSNFAQIYLLDTDPAVDMRLQHQDPADRDGNGTGLLREYVEAIQEWIQSFNQNTTIYRTAVERFQDAVDGAVVRTRQIRGGPDPRRYNLPLDNTEVAAVVLSDSERRDNGGDLLIEQRADGRLERLSELHKSFMGMHFPLIHVRGEVGWHGGIPWKNAPFEPKRYRLLQDQPNDNLSDSDEDGRVPERAQTREGQDGPERSATGAKGDRDGEDDIQFARR